jgi:DNA-directed RNA polymerase specialized sigma24 family protein
MMTLDETQTTSNQAPSRLQTLAVQAQNSEPGSQQRYRALTLLIQELRKQPTFGILRKGLKAKYANLSDGLFEDLFNDALQETSIAVSRCIDKYDSRRPLLPLICKIISNKFSNLRKKHCKYGVTRIPKSNAKNQTQQGKVISLDALDEFVQDSIMNQHASNTEGRSISNCDLLRELLIYDPDNQLKAFVRGKPDITFQYIAIYLYVKGKNMQQLANELEIPYQTLNSFFKRNLVKLEQYFREKLQH